MFAHLHDEELRTSLNNQELNYWDAYIREIKDMLGIRGCELSVKELEKTGSLNHIQTIIIGCQTSAQLSNKALENLRKWVMDGGLIIGFGTNCLQDVFGIEVISSVKQTPDDYSINLYFQLLPHKLTNGIHQLLSSEQNLFTLSDSNIIKSDKASALAQFTARNGLNSVSPAVTWNSYGNGHAAYFAFDPAKTIWLLHQGRPLNGRDQACIGHSSELSVIGKNSRNVPYADEIAFLIQNIIASKPHPFIYQMPADGNGNIPDALFYWGGDEYNGPTELSTKSSDWMREKKLPYHINIEPDRHPMTKEEFRHITEDNKHEISIYYHPDYSSDKKHLDPKLFNNLSNLFVQRFGVKPGSTLFWNTHWSGWTEPVRLMLECGGTADNSFFNALIENKDNPYRNGPFYGFGCGTAYPFHFYEDYSRMNRKLEFIEQPIVCYELGHRGSMPDSQNKDLFCEDELHHFIDVAVRYHSVINIFYHPVYIVNYPQCRKAIEEIIKYINLRNYNVLHMANNQIADWWLTRSHIEIYDEIFNNISFSFKCSNTYDSRIIIKYPLNDSGVLSVVSNGNNMNHEVKCEFGICWLYIFVEPGESDITINFQKG